MDAKIGLSDKIIPAKIIIKSNDSQETADAKNYSVINGQILVGPTFSLINPRDPQGGAGTVL